jgi:hypothetical protein
MAVRNTMVNNLKKEYADIMGAHRNKVFEAFCHKYERSRLGRQIFKFT